MSTESFEELQARYMAGEPLSSEAADRLHRWLDRSPTQRDELLIEEAVQNQLRCLARLDDDELTERFVRETVQRVLSSQPSAEAVDVIVTRKTERRRPFQWFSVPAGLCATALILIGVAVAWNAILGRQQTDFGFAKIANARNLSWELIDDDSRRLSVSSGSGEVHFENGAIARLSAPAVVELTAPGRLFVETGSIKVDVPPAAVGFTVETPVARIVDFGTQFDVVVGEAGQTEIRVRSGTVTFESHLMRFAQSPPIKLTDGGLNLASAVPSELTADVRSIETTASGAEGQFYGTIHADGKTVEFSNRQAFDDFRNRLHSSVQQNPAGFHEQWEVMVETTANGASTTVKGSGGSGILNGSSGGSAHEMLIEQLRAMQGRHQGNSQMQQLLDDMIRQAEEGLEKTRD